jgi:hypothetical protein
MGETSAPHTTRLTILVRLLGLLAAASILLLLSPGRARADGLVDGVQGAAGDTLGSAVTTTTDVADQGASSAADAAQQVSMSVDAALHRAVSSTDRTVHRALTAAGRAVKGRGHNGPPATLPTAASGHVSPVGRSHMRPHAHISHPVVGLERDTAPVPTSAAAAATTTVRTEQGVANEGRSAASSPQRRPARGGRSDGGATIPAGSGSIEPGARGGQLAVMLVAAILLAGAWSRWRRPWAVARAPNPLVPILVPPG